MKKLSLKVTESYMFPRNAVGFYRSSFLVLFGNSTYVFVLLWILKRSTYIEMLLNIYDNDVDMFLLLLYCLKYNYIFLFQLLILN